MASSPPWKISLGTSPRKSSAPIIVIKELEQKLAKKNRNSQGTAEFKFTDLTKVSPESEQEGGARQSKTMSEKQLIHENLLQARARWLAQNKEREDSPASGAGEEETTTTGDERKAFVQSLDTTKRFCIDSNDRGPQESEHIPLRTSRAYSNSIPKAQNRVLPRPPKNRPPVFDSKQQQQKGEATFYIPPANSSTSSESQGQSVTQQKATDKPTKTKKAVKRLLALAKGKGKNTKQSSSTSKLPNTSTTATAPVKKVGLKKVLSENVLVSRQVSNHLRDDSSSSSAKSYQNVFDDPAYSHYFQQHMESRSNSSSPVDMTRNRKPKPLPRKGAASSRNSTCSTDQDSEAALSPLSRTFSPTARTTSPLSASRMSNHTSTDSLTTPNLDLGDTDRINMIVRQRARDDLENSLGSQLPSGKKTALCKTASFNPQGDSTWDPIKRQTSSRQKKLRRAVFSDGDQQDELTDDYIKMNSICIADHSPSPPPSSQKKISDPGPRFSPARESSPTPSNPTKSLSALPSVNPSGYQGLNVPVDPKRMSAYYLKIICGQTKTVPSASVHTSSPKSQADDILRAGEEKEGFYIGDGLSAQGQDTALDSESPNDPGAAKRDRKSATPPKLVLSQDGSTVRSETLPPSTEKPSFQKARKFQYTSVTVDLQGPAAKKRVPSIPKKFKYKAVTLSQTGKPILEEDEPPCSNEESFENKQESTQILEQPTIEEEPILDIPSLPKGQHPLVNLSSTSSEKNERSFYVNRKSLIELESCKDLPTTMLSTVDNTGKVIWHEYVEIDEDKLNVMANSMGVANSAPIPEKLSKLLGLPQQLERLEESVPTVPEEPEESIQDEPVPDDSIEPPADQPQQRNSLLESFASSQSSTDGDYIFNLNAPPSVPPRPDNLDALVNQIKVKTSSGDYSYAVIPEKQLFGKHWMIFKSRPPAKSISAASREKANDAAADCPKEKPFEMSHKNSSSNTKSAKKEAKLAPPSVPPKTKSLLREQSLSSDIGVTTPPGASGQEPFLTPIIVKTKEKKPTSKGGKEKGSPTFISYIRDQVGTLTPIFSNGGKGSQEVSSKQRNFSPPKPIPYEEHQRKKKMGLLSNPGSPADAFDTPTPFSPKRQKARTKPLHHHKKLARQKSHRASGKLGNHHYRSSQRRRQNHTDATPWNGKLTLGQGGVQKRKKPRGPRPEQIEKLCRESLAAMISDEDLLDESSHGLLQDAQESTPGSGVNPISPPIEGTASPSGRDLDRILNELGHILKNNECSEEDLLTAIENQLKINLRKNLISSPLPTTSHPMSIDHNQSIESDENELLGTNETEHAQEDDNEDISSNEEAERGASPTQSITTVLKTLSVEEKLAKSLNVKKHSYVNFEFADDEDDEPAYKDRPKIDRPKSTHYKPRYYNLEYFDEHGNVASIDNDNESSDDDFEYSYVHPNQTIEIRGLFRAAQQAKTSKASTTDQRSFKPLSIPKICTTSENRLDVCPVSSTPSSSERGETTRSPIPRERSKSSMPSSSRNQLLLAPANRQVRTQSNPPDPEQLKQTNTSDSSSNDESNLDFPSKSSSTISLTSKQDPEESLQTKAPIAGAVGENTSSYNLALEMEDLRFSKSVQVPHKVRLPEVVDEQEKGLRDRRSHSTSNKPLHRINAKRKASGSCPTYTNGIGAFTQKGGRLMKVGSDVTIEVPENAISQGSQKLRFEVKQSVYNPSIDEESSSFSDSGSIEIESLLEEKKDKRIQLSPTVTVGPSDVVLDHPITIRIPHCLPYRNNSWHLQMLGRAPIGDKEGDDGGWCEIANTIGLVQLSTKGNSNKFHKKSTYQMHLDYVQVKTCRLGSFKLVGRPIRNGTYAAKKMVASVFSKVHPNRQSVQFDIFVNNAIEDQSNALETSLLSHGHSPLLKGMPILCFGDGKDMEVTLSNESNTAIPLGTKAIPFGQFWRHNKVGQSHIIYDIDTDLVEDDRTLTLKIQQADSKLYHETNFYLPEI